jgi:uncharacterized protein (DUF1015 family)
MPDVRPFRALRYDPEVVADLSMVVAPPYDVITPERRSELAARDPRNIVAVELPQAETGDQPEDRYRRAARTLAAWRSGGVLRKDPRASWYAYEQTYSVPGTGQPLVQRGYFCLVRLTPYGLAGGILPHERTLDAPREDRYRLLRATGTNTSAAVGLYEDPTGSAGDGLADIGRRPPTATAREDDLVEHRLWRIEEDDPVASELAAPARRGPIVIADGHHRYETALRYRDERHMTRSCEEDPPFDWVLILLLSTSEPLTILPTHRLVHGLGAAEASAVMVRATELFDVRQTDRSALENRLEVLRGGGRIGLISASGAAILVPRPDAVGPFLPPGGPAVRGLDVTTVDVALERLWSIDAKDVAGGRLSYTTSVPDAIAAVDRGIADAAFLLPATPVGDVLAVAREGDVMPQKSTHFYPKALAGLVLNPHEW